VRHHVGRYGPLVASMPEAADRVLRSLQTHPTTGHSDLVGVDDDDGTAETWFDDLAGLEAVLGSPTCRERVFPDERSFLGYWSSQGWLATSPGNSRG
jgi:EthD domain